MDILDHATRSNTGTRLYPAENLLAHFDFLSRVLLAHGRPDGDIFLLKSPPSKHSLPLVLPHSPVF